MNIKRGDGLNVVPFIDVMLVLLALVLSISTFIAQGAIKVDVPNASTQAQNTEEKKYSISVTNDNKIFIDEKEVSEDDLEATMSTISKDMLVEYNGDKNSGLEILVKVIDVLTKQGHQSDKFQINTQKN